MIKFGKTDFICLSIFVCISSLFSMTVRADEIYLQDGDVLKGDIVERTENELILQRSSGEEQVVLRSDVRNFIIERTKVILKGGDNLSGRLVEDSKDQLVLEVDRGVKITLAKESIKETEKVKKRYAGTPPGQELPMEGPYFWSGEFSMGYTARRGNTDEDDFYVRGLLAYDRKPITNETTAQFNYAKSDGATTQDQADLENQFNYTVIPNGFLYHDLQVGYDNIRRIDYFVDTSGGIGVELLVDSPSTLKFRTGPSYRFEKREAAEDSSEVSALIAESFRTKLNSRMTFRQEYKFLPSITNSGEYRQEASVELKIALSNSWTLNLYGEQVYDSDPVPGTEKEDLRFVSTLGYNF